MTFLTKSRITLLLAMILSVFLISCGERTQYQVGDIVLSDGKVISKDNFASYKGSAKPMAIIFSTSGGHLEESERVLCVGLKYSEPVQFAAKDSAGYQTNMLANQVYMLEDDFSISDGKFSNSGFIGLLDGRKTWSNIAYYDSEAKSSFKGYPAYDFAVNYGKNNGFKKFEKGWYLPTAAEAYELAANREVVNEAMGLCGCETLDDIIWTSSQGYDSKPMEYVVDLLDANVDLGFKDNECYVYSIYCFK